jgi:hypothetical protein
MLSWKRHALVVGLLGAGVAGAFYAGVAYAADQNLADADNNCLKAIAFLEAASNPGQNPPFGGHRAKAISHIKKARAEIKKAQQFQDKPPPPKHPKPKKPSGH